MGDITVELDTESWEEAEGSLENLSSTEKVAVEDNVSFCWDVEDVGVISMIGAKVGVILIILTENGFASSDDGSQIEFIPVSVDESLVFVDSNADSTLS